MITAESIRAVLTPRTRALATERDLKVIEDCAQAQGAQYKGRSVERLPVARELGETSLMFFVHPTLTDAEIEKTCAVLTEVMIEAAY